MCGRLLSLWHASYGYTDRVANRDNGKLGRLVLIGIPRWCDVGDCQRARGVGEECSSCLGPRKRSVVEVSSGGVGGSRLSDVGVSCRNPRRRRGRCDGALAKLRTAAGAPVPAEV